MASVRVWLGAAVLVSIATVAAATESTEPSIPAAKPGLYEVRKTSNIAIFIARDYSNTPIEEQKRLSDVALARPGPTFQICITPESAPVLDQMAGKQPGCSNANVQSGPHGFVADVSCDAKPPVHIDFRLDTPEHRSVIVSGGRLANAAISLIESYDIRLLSADCGTLKPGAIKPVPSAPARHP